MTLHVVEIRLVGADLAVSMNEMRTWLDHNHCQPDGFRHSRGGAGITFRVDFKQESEAAAFAKAFGGRLAGIAPPGADAAMLWR